MKLKAVSGIMLTLLLMGMLTFAFNIQQVKASGTIYIGADGSVDPDTAPISSVDNVTYIFTNNNYDSIVVERDNIVVDGAGYTLQGTGSGTGIDLTGRSNVTIKNINIRRFWDGIWLNMSSSNIIFENSIWPCYRDNEHGIVLYDSSNNTISRNSIYTYYWWLNHLHGIVLYDSSNNTISENSVYNDWWAGIRLEYSSNNTISENNMRNNKYGIMLSWSPNNSISGNTITNNEWDGISVWESDYNSISGNHIANNDNGVGLGFSSNNTIFGNTITDNDGAGIDLSFSSDYNSISGNTMANNEWDGIGLYGRESLVGPSYNIIKVNNITNNNYGIGLSWSSNNSIYHNNFMDNSEQVRSKSSTNVWDDGYPSGGNYWSDHVCTGNPSDGSQPYIIDADNVDHYPFQHPNGWLLHQLSVTSSPITGITFTINGTQETTPYTEWLPEGSYTLIMPETHNGYVWSHWLEDGNPNRIKTILLQGTTWTAVYESAPPPPVGGKATPIDKVAVKTELHNPLIWLSTIISAIAVAASFKYRKKQ